MNIEPTKYYDEFLRYYELAKRQQEESNLGTIAHVHGSVDDDLMKHVELYDVVNRKFAGFTQILLDLWYNDTKEHPYSHKLHAVRTPICKSYSGVHSSWGLKEWLYVFITHRVTGSGINYAKKPSGYNNTILPAFSKCESIPDMVKVIADRDQKKSIYTSVGYQFPAFPKAKPGFRLGGDYFLCRFAPQLAEELAAYLEHGNKKTLREVGYWMHDWNKRHGLRAYKFQYAAVVADIADFYPQLVETDSSFFYGTNAEECISYLAKPAGKGTKIDFLDAVMDKIYEDTGAVPYDAEDVCCDYIRWIENYVRPGADYDHVDRDKIFSSCKITDHPFGRQKGMLKLGLLNSFNDLTVHPSDAYVLDRNGLSVEEYKVKINNL